MITMPYTGRCGHPSRRSAPHCFDLDQQHGHVMSARRVHEALQPATEGWFLLTHKNAAAWILMHRPRRAAEWPVAAHNSIVMRTRGAHITRFSAANQDDSGWDVVTERSAQRRWCIKMEVHRARKTRHGHRRPRYARTDPGQRWMCSSSPPVLTRLNLASPTGPGASEAVIRGKLR